MSSSYTKFSNKISKYMVHYALVLFYFLFGSIWLRHHANTNKMSTFNGKLLIFHLAFHLRPT